MYMLHYVVHDVSSQFKIQQPGSLYDSHVLCPLGTSHVGFVMDVTHVTTHADVTTGAIIITLRADVTDVNGLRVVQAVTDVKRRADVVALRTEAANTMVGAVGDVDATTVVRTDALRVIQLTLTAALAAKASQQRTVRVKDPNTV